MSDTSMYDEWFELSYYWRREARLAAIENQTAKRIWSWTPLLRIEYESLRRELAVLMPGRNWYA